MRVLVTGAYGLIGSAVMARLHRDGHTVVGAGRSLEDARRRFAYAQWVAADYSRLRNAAAWLPLLAGIDAVVNCVGVLQKGSRDDVRGVQVEGTRALFDACVQAGIRRVVHVSAVGAESAGTTEFSRSKADADAYLAGLDLDWAILKPGLVLGPLAHGGSAMLRGLAGVPLATPLIAPDARVLVVCVGDLAATVAYCLAPGAPARVTWELTHPEPVTLGGIVTATRRWLGFPPRPVVQVPRWAAGFVSFVADGLGWLGWRSPARSTSLKQLAAGMQADPAPWIAATGIKPKSLDDIFAAQAASVQDRWHARLYFVKPLAIGLLSAFWILTGLISLGPGWNEGMALLAPLGLASSVAGSLIVAGAVLDIALGGALLVRSLARPVLIVMLLMCVVYLVLATATVPALWLDPLGRLTKIFAAMLATVFTLGVLDER